MSYKHNHYVPEWYTIILVLDITRWGRFQDADESAYYEYICRSSGIDVQYVAEQFENDGSPVSTIVKGVKRAMAGEYLGTLLGNARVVRYLAQNHGDIFRESQKIADISNLNKGEAA